MMNDFYIICYIISLSIAVITLIVGIYVGIKRLHTVRILPRALRLYIITCCFPYFFSTTICSIYMAIYFLIYHSQSHFSFEIFRNIISFSSQQIRSTFILVVCERIIATVKLEKYTLADSNTLLWRLTAISYFTSTFYLVYNIWAKSIPDQPWLYNITNYYAYFAHIFMLSVCAILYLANRRMYKISAYRITLKRRYTIAQNVKSLTYLFPSTLIYSLCAQFGSVITIAFQTLNLPTAPLCIYHIFFNLSFLLIYIRHYCIHPDRITTIKSERTVKNPLGKNIPTNVTSEQYFRHLQHQWNT